MKRIRNFETNKQPLLVWLVKAGLSLLILLSVVLLFMAILSCAKNSTDPELEGTKSVGGTVKGTLKDLQGNPYPGSKIELNKGSEVISKETSSEGTFTLNTKDIGTYQITATPPLSTELVANTPATVNVGKEMTTTIDFIIEPQPVKAHLNFGDVQLLKEIVDKDGNIPSNPGEPLFAANIFDPPLGKLTAIKAPDGHHVTLSEFKMAKGNLLVSCNGNSSKVNIILEGLIPNGTYTFWLAYLNITRKVGEPIDFMNDFVNRTNPPIGSADGTQNIAIADADGNLDIVLEHNSCILTDEVALVIPVLYHLNGKTFGGGHVPDEEEMVHMLVFFQ